MLRSQRSIVSVGLVVIAVMVLVSSFSVPIRAQTASTTLSTTVSTTSTTTMQSLSIISSNSTTTSTTSTTTLSTTSSIQVVTVTSVATIGSTTFQNPSTGGGGIPGFPLEAILLGILLGGAVLGLLRRRRAGDRN
ncbi:MAG: hypothetical protein ACLPY5_08870 [Candidatus Bathyarchaeia archaeon]